MSASFSKPSKPTFAHSQKVVVIGGGIAGLTTAYRLHKGGMNVELYEARNRVGGRILTAKVNGHIAELGSQNIRDGGEAINLNSLIDELGLQRDSNRVLLNHSYFNGEALIPMSEVLKDKKIDPRILKNQLLECALTCHNIKEVLEKLVDPHDPLYKILAVRTAAYEGGTIEKLSPLYIKTLFQMFLGVIYSAQESEDLYIDRLTVAGGNGMLPKKIGDVLGTRLHLNMPLTNVAKREDGSFQLTFKNGEQVEANIVVLAMPCSVYEQIIFESDVIDFQKLEAIRNVQYGTNAKIIVPLAPPPAKSTGFVIADEGISSFDGAQQLLTMYYAGKASLFCPETIADSYAQIQPLLQASFTSDCLPAALPAYAEDQFGRSYDGPVGYSWPNDPYAKGSYSYIATGQEEILTSTIEQHGETFKTLFAPIERHLYFAGEHASILSEVSGTMEAACESGERIARAIMQDHAYHQE
jgi:monoamine oxidase